MKLLRGWLYMCIDVCDVGIGILQLRIDLKYDNTYKTAAILN